jgi:hypothetical protein
LNDAPGGAPGAGREIGRAGEKQFRCDQMNRNKKIIEKPEDRMLLFKSSNGNIGLNVRLEGESVWLTQKQISLLFETERSVVTKHIGNIFKTKELSRKAVCAKFAHTAEDGKTYKVDYYNLDAIISVGYRINSKRGTQFRIWATRVLREHIIQGYTINEKRLKEQNSRLLELERTVELLGSIIDRKELAVDEAGGLLRVVTDYAHGLKLLDQYDYQKLTIADTTLPASFIMTYEKAHNAIERMAERMRFENRNPELFGIERGGEFKGAIASVYQTVNGRDAYPSVEEKAAHL